MQSQPATLPVMSAQDKAFKVLEFILNKQAQRPVILDVSGLTNYCEYFIVCSAESTTGVQAIFNEVLGRCKQQGIRVHHWAKDEQGSWFLVDLFDLVLHIFTEAQREFYNLEYLWRQAKIIEPKPLAKKPRKKTRSVV